MGHAVVVLDIYKNLQTGEYILQIKNSWGTDSAYYELIYISLDIFKDLGNSFLDVYFYESDLSYDLKRSYDKFIASCGSLEEYRRKAYQEN